MIREQGRDGERMWEVGRCLGSMTSIPDHLSTFIRFIQLKSLRPRTEHWKGARSHKEEEAANKDDRYEGAREGG